MTDTPETPKPKQRRGFAAMDPEKARAIQSKGGVMAHVKGVAHELKGDKAKQAGSKGGIKTASKPGHMAAIGAKGGSAKKTK